MAEADHLRRAKENESFAATLSPETRGDWKIIVTFYSALHYIEATLSRLNEKSSDHRSRKKLMRKHNAFSQVLADYDTLSNFAWEARYDPVIKYKPDQVQEVVDLLPAIRGSLGF